jgi:hypothetical protein
VVEAVRSLWAAADQADAAVRNRGRKTIIDGISRLDRQVTTRLRLAAALVSMSKGGRSTKRAG